jgi:hypothetical protein
MAGNSEAYRRTSREKPAYHQLAFSANSQLTKIPFITTWWGWDEGSL